VSGDISIAIFSARETPDTLFGTVRAALEASRGVPACCDVIVNGPSADLADALCGRLAGHTLPHGTAVRVFHIPVADKAFSWNEYVHRLWPSSALAFFVDGYAQVLPGALKSLQAAMGDDPHILGGTGVPTHGRSAMRLREEMLRSGGIHGNLFALRGAVMEHFRATGFRLPAGIYRNDATIGSLIKFNLDPSRHEWDEGRLVVDPDATWIVAPSSQSLADRVRGHYRRMLRQAQGRLENRAVRQHLAIDRCLPEDLPETNYELVRGWVERHADEARALFRQHPLARLAYSRMQPWRGGPAEPVLVGRFAACGG
jgi:hypothetical protein